MAVRASERSDFMKERLTIRRRGQVTLPKAILERFDLEEGDTLELSVDEKTGEMRVIPMIQVPTNQRWFWTEEWQKEEREADEDIRAGRVHAFDNVNDVISWLDNDDDEE